MDGLFTRYWRSLIGLPALPRHPEPAEEQEPDDGRISGLVDEAN
ncbi:hypothetical protein AB0F17_15965 [Nonomuraea sp. NPDC026600]